MLQGVISSPVDASLKYYCVVMALPEIHSESTLRPNSLTNHRMHFVLIDLKINRFSVSIQQNCQRVTFIVTRSNFRAGFSDKWSVKC